MFIFFEIFRPKTYSGSRGKLNQCLLLLLHKFIFKKESEGKLVLLDLNTGCLIQAATKKKTPCIVIIEVYRF